MHAALTLSGMTDVAALPTAVPKVMPVQVFGVPFLALERAPAPATSHHCPIDGTWRRQAEGRAGGGTR